MVFMMETGLGNTLEIVDSVNAHIFANRKVTIEDISE